jgi:hypothetical protein
MRRWFQHASLSWATHPLPRPGFACRPPRASSCLLEVMLHRSSRSNWPRSYAHAQDYGHRLICGMPESRRRSGPTPAAEHLVATRAPTRQPPTPRLGLLSGRLDAERYWSAFAGLGSSATSGSSAGVRKTCRRSPKPRSLRNNTRPGAARRGVTNAVRNTPTGAAPTAHRSSSAAAGVRPLRRAVRSTANKRASASAVRCRYISRCSCLIVGRRR